MGEGTRCGSAIPLNEAATSTSADHSKKIRPHCSALREMSRVFQVILFALVVEWCRPMACFEPLDRTI